MDNQKNIFLNDSIDTNQEDYNQILNKYNDKSVDSIFNLLNHKNSKQDELDVIKYEFLDKFYSKIEE